MDERDGGTGANASWGVVNEHVDVQADHAGLIQEIGAKSVGSPPQERRFPAPSESGLHSCRRRRHAGQPRWTERVRRQGVQQRDFGWGWGQVALVFANANAGENYVFVDGNEGDRNNLTLWKNGDTLISAVAGVHTNTVVILHTAGPVLVEEYKTHPNITAIVWVGLPGQESGNPLVDVLYGDMNPRSYTPFTWGKQPEDWGVQFLYEAETYPPSQNLTRGYSSTTGTLTRTTSSRVLNLGLA